MEFLHAADLHLGLGITRLPPEKNRQVREARFTALDNLKKEAVQRKVDFVLLAGDLFDDNGVDTVTAQRAFSLLESFPCPVFVIPGNHDPLTVGSPWEYPPWDEPGERVQLLRKAEPVPLPGGGVLYPCPLFEKSSVLDPTAWIPEREPGDTSIRIALAHGSLRVRDDLPPEDHLIDPQLAQAKGLDYVALGHWHRPSPPEGEEGQGRIFYSGVHEPMRFSDIGWHPQSGPGEWFQDQGRGNAWHVCIQQAGLSPEVKPVDTTHLLWEERCVPITCEEDLSRLIAEVAQASQPGPERRLLRLRLQGCVDAACWQRLGELDAQYGQGQNAVLDRYFWAQLDTSGLAVEPREEELDELLGQGILRDIHEHLRQEMNSTDRKTRAVAQEAVRILYQLARSTRA